MQLQSRWLLRRPGEPQKKPLSFTRGGGGCILRDQKSTCETNQSHQAMEFLGNLCGKNLYSVVRLSCTTSRQSQHGQNGRDFQVIIRDIDFDGLHDLEPVTLIQFISWRTTKQPGDDVFSICSLNAPLEQLLADTLTLIRGIHDQAMEICYEQDRLGQWTGS
jgi:hypothetical protein